MSGQYEVPANPPGFFFDEDTHTYQIGERVLPGVTTVLKRLYDFSGIPAAVLEAAGIRGRYVHAAIDLWMQGDLDTESLMPQFVPYIDAARRFIDDQGDDLQVILHEKPLAYEAMGYAGTPDLLAVWGGTLSVLDWKTTGRVSPVDALQTAAYAAMIDRESVTADMVKRRATLHLKPDGEYQVVPWTDRYDRTVFFAELTSYKWRIRHGKS